LNFGKWHWCWQDLKNEKLLLLEHIVWVAHGAPPNDGEWEGGSCSLHIFSHCATQTTRLP